MSSELRLCTYGIDWLKFLVSGTATMQSYQPPPTYFIHQTSKKNYNSTTHYQMRSTKTAVTSTVCSTWYQYPNLLTVWNRNFIGSLVHWEGQQLIQVATRCNAWVCGHTLAGNSGCNHATGMDVSLLQMLCAVRYKSVQWADHSSRGVLRNSVKLSKVW